MKTSYGITQKIWLSLSILIFGYLFSMVVGFLLGHKTEISLLRVAEKRFPIAQKSKAALVSFREQIRLYSEAVMTGDGSGVEMADEKAREVVRLIKEIAEIKSADDPVRKELLDTIDELEKFGTKAATIYMQLSKDYDRASIDLELTINIRDLANQIENFQNRLKAFTVKFSEDLRNDLADARKASRTQRYMNLAVFVMVVICSTILTAAVISRFITGPLRKSLMLEKVVEQFADGIAITGIDGKIRFVNLAWAQMHGYKPKELKGKDMDLFHSEEQIRDELIPFNAVVEKEGLNSGEIGHIRKDGNVFPTFMSTSQMLDESGRIFCIATSARDITMQKLREEELRRAKKQAEAASVAKSDFLANMSHEIRTPLNGVMGVLNLLSDTELDEEQLDLVKTGKASADGLLTVISDILDFSKIEAGKLDMEVLEFDLRNQLESAVELPAMQAQGKMLEFAYYVANDVPSLLKGDPGRLRQIILNLTNNAIKFTDKGEIFLNVLNEAETDRDVKLRFEIKDTGIGISEEKLALIFDSFEQSDTSTTRLYGGTGLGLSISKKLAELMHGEIGVESEVGKGSVFWFTARFEKQPRTAEQLVIPQDMHHKRFLLVDDNKTNLNILSGYMKSWNFTFDVAMSGEVALTLMHAVAKVNAPFDAVIVDMLMPGMDGAQLCGKIRDDDLFKNTKLVMLTSMGVKSDGARLQGIGLDASLTKPIRKSQLFSCLISLFADTSDPVETAEPASPSKDNSLENAGEKIRILLVEDNIVNQKLMVKMIEKSGFKADVAANGREALKRLEQFEYDMVLMDVQMPVMDGFEATRRIRHPQSTVINRDIPIVALTANAMKGDREKCLEAGMTDYITKPVQADDLLNAIEKSTL